MASLYVSGKLLTYPSPKPTLTLTSQSYWWWVTIQTWVVLLIGWGKFSTNQKHCSGLDSDTSTVSNLCSCSSFCVETSGGVLKVLAVFPLPLSYIIKTRSVEQGLRWLLVKFENLLDLVNYTCHTWCWPSRHWTLICITIGNGKIIYCIQVIWR